MCQCSDIYFLMCWCSDTYFFNVPVQRYLFFNVLVQQYYIFNVLVQQSSPFSVSVPVFAFQCASILYLTFYVLAFCQHSILNLLCTNILLVSYISHFVYQRLPSILYTTFCVLASYHNLFMCQYPNCNLQCHSVVTLICKALVSLSI